MPWLDGEHADAERPPTLRDSRLAVTAGGPVERLGVVPLERDDLLFCNVLTSHLAESLLDDRPARSSWWPEISPE